MKNLSQIIIAAMIAAAAPAAQGFEPGLAPGQPVAADTAQQKPPLGPLRPGVRPLAGKPGRAAAKGAPAEVYATADGTRIYGGIVYADSWSSDNTPYGIYSASTSAPINVNSEYLGSLFKVNGGGFYANGKYYFIDYTVSNSGEDEVVYTYMYISDAYPFSYREEVSLGMDHIAKDLTFDPIEQRAYGIFSIGNLEANYLIGAMDITGRYTLEEFCRLAEPHVAIASDAKGNIFTIGSDGMLYRLDKQAREMKPVGPTGVSSVHAQYAQSATIDLNTGVMYWAALDGDGFSALYTVDTTTGHATKIGDFPDNEEFAGIYIPDIINPAAPAAADELFTDFIDGSLQGVVAFDAPKTRHNGVNLSGNMTYVLTTNGEETARGETRAGKRNVEIETEVPDNGFYTFTLRLENESGSSLPTTLRTYIGNDVPVAPANATATNQNREGKINVKWQRPRRGVNNGFMDMAALTYDVRRLPDDVIVAKAIADTVYTDNIEDTSLRCYSYEITPQANGVTGLSAVTNKVIVGEVAEVPYLETFDTDVDFSTFTVDDVDNDAKGSANGWGTWVQSGYDGGVAQATPAGGDYAGNAKDDWLFTPPVHLRADRTYKLTYKAMSQGNSIVPSFIEHMEVKLGNAPSKEAMTETLLENCAINSKYGYYNDYEHTIHVNEEGNYHIGFHATTPGDEIMWILDLDNISIVEGALAEGPARVGDLKAEAGAKGASEVKLTFTAPTVAINGTALTAIEKIEILRAGSVITTIENPTPGAGCEYTDREPEQGINQYTVVAYDEKNRGLESKTIVYVGFDIPAAVTGLTLRDADGHPKVSWNPVSETGENGYYVDPEAVTYTVERYFSAYDNKIVAENISELEFTDPEATADEQTQVIYRVTPSNSKGTGKTASSESIFIGGEDSALPVHESFPGRMSTSPALRYISCETGSQWGVAEAIDNITPVDNDGGMALFGLNGYAIPGPEGIQGMIFSNRISIKGAINPTLTFYFYYENGSENKLDVLVNPSSEGWRTVTTVPLAPADSKEGWRQITVPLTEFAAERYVQIAFRGTAIDDGVIFLDNITLDDLLEHNLRLTSATADRLAAPGETVAVKVNVTNRGINPASSYTVALRSDDGSFEAKTSGKTLQPGSSADLTLNFPVTLGTPETNRLQAFVEYAPDMKESDDASEILEINVELPRMAYVTDLRGNLEGGDVKLTWNAPDASTAAPEPLTDNFDSYQSFIIDNVGGWSMHDGDGQRTWGISDGTGQGSILKYDHAGEAMAWQVFNPVKAGLSVNYDPNAGEGMYEVPDWRPYSGSQMLISYAPRTGMSDDWLISPLLSTTRQTVSFMGRSVLTTYHERVEVLASSAGTDPDDFEKVDDCAFTKEWTRYAALLPEGTRYFAIRCVSPQQFAALVDDVTYADADCTPADSRLEGYNVYVNGRKVNDAPVAATAWSGAAPEGKNDYRVSAVYDSGESRLSNTVSLGESGIGSTGADSFEIRISGNLVTISGIGRSGATLAAADGTIAGEADGSSPTAEFRLAQGVYVIKAGNTTRKIIIR